MKRDKDNVVIPDRKEAWKRIRMWYEGRLSRISMSMYAHKKMSSLKLYSGLAASYLSEITNCFEILEDAKEKQSKTAKINALLGGIHDSKYAVTH